jgi:hypothetical protein
LPAKNIDALTWMAMRVRMAGNFAGGDLTRN